MCCKRLFSKRSCDMAKASWGAVLGRLSGAASWHPAQVCSTTVRSLLPGRLPDLPLLVTPTAVLQPAPACPRVWTSGGHRDGCQLNVWLLPLACTVHSLGHANVLGAGTWLARGWAVRAVPIPAPSQPQGCRRGRRGGAATPPYLSRGRRQWPCGAPHPPSSSSSSWRGSTRTAGEKQAYRCTS